MLRCEAIDTGYGRAQVLRGFSLDVQAGEILCLFGRNGAGKTTAMKAIMGLLPLWSGGITVGGEAIGHLPAHQVPLHGIGYVPQGRRLFSELTVAQNLEIGLRARRSGPETEAEVLALFPRLKERYRQRAETLSGGEQQMLVIGRALLTSPRIMTIDEPSLGLAPNLVDRVYETLLELRKDRGLTLLIVEQSSERALKSADRLYVLRSGQMQLEGNVADLQAGEKVRQAYFGFDEGATHGDEVAF